MKDYFNLRKSETAALCAPRNVGGGIKPGGGTFVCISSSDSHGPEK